MIIYYVYYAYVLSTIHILLLELLYLSNQMEYYSGSIIVIYIMLTILIYSTYVRIASSILSYLIRYQQIDYYTIGRIPNSMPILAIVDNFTIIQIYGVSLSIYVSTFVSIIILSFIYDSLLILSFFSTYASILSAYVLSTIEISYAFMLLYLTSL